MFIEILFIVAKPWKQVLKKNPPTTERIHRMQGVHQWTTTVQKKRNQELIRVTAEMDLKILMLSQRRQVQKTIHYMTSCIRNFQRMEMNKNKKWITGDRVWV